MRSCAPRDPRPARPQFWVVDSFLMLAPDRRTAPARLKPVASGYGAI
jgi:hypothetical protein